MRYIVTQGGLGFFVVDTEASADTFVDGPFHARYKAMQAAEALNQGLPR